jgi:hypothetical protein
VQRGTPVLLGRLERLAMLGQAPTLQTQAALGQAPLGVQATTDRPA